MQLSEIRKALVAVVGAVPLVVTQVLALGPGIISQTAANWMAIVSAVAVAVGVYLVPNKRTVQEKIEDTVDALRPGAEAVRSIVVEELNRRRNQVASPAIHVSGLSAESTEESTPEPVREVSRTTDRLAVPPMG